jgi:hypothetical protein
MVTHFIEASDGMMHGKFMLGRLDSAELGVRSALPGSEEDPLMRVGGRRRLNERSTLIVDLQTGNGAAFFIGGGLWIADLNRTGPIHVCPMFPPFLKWLYEQKVPDFPATAIEQLPRYVRITHE